MAKPLFIENQGNPTRSYGGMWFCILVMLGSSAYAITQTLSALELAISIIVSPLIILTPVVLIALVLLWVPPWIALSGFIKAKRGFKRKAIHRAVLAISMSLLFAGLMFVLKANGIQSRSDLIHESNCREQVTDASAIGRECQEDYSLCQLDDTQCMCPAGYQCFKEYGASKATCIIFCQFNCKCPKGFSCQNGRCERKK